MNNIKKIKWIFFDIGGVLVDDSEYENRRIDSIYKTVKNYRPDITKKDILEVRPKASGMLGGLTANIVSLFLKEEDKRQTVLRDIDKNWRNRDISAVRPEAKNILEKLSEKYNLGLMANQPVKVRERLERSDLLKYFRIKKVSEDFNLSKPDPAFFKLILQKCNTNPEQVAIIDDNIERGLIPAKKLGMTTVWFKLEERDVPDSVGYAVSNLDGLLDIFLSVNQ